MNLYIHLDGSPKIRSTLLRFTAVRTSIFDSDGRSHVCMHILTSVFFACILQFALCDYTGKLLLFGRVWDNKV